MINKIKSFVNANKKDLIYLFILVFLLLVISIPKLCIQYNIGIGNWDTYLYLENGRNFAKMGWGDVSSIAPVLPMILSKMFLIAGHTYQEAIFNIDVLFYILGVVSFYLLLRLKYKQEISLFGSIIYATFTLLYSWVAIGGNDIIGVCGTILSIYLIFISHRFNYKYYYIALPIAAYSFLSRYTAGVMLFSIVFYWIINKISLNELKHIIVGGFLGIISISWFLNQFNKTLGTPFPFLGQFSGTVSNTVVMDSGFLPDSWYYIKHVPNYLSSIVPANDTFNAIVNPMGNFPTLLSYIYIGLFIIAFILLIKNVLNENINYDKKDWILFIIAIIIGIIDLVTINSVSYIVSIILFLVVLGLTWITLDKYDIKDLDYEFVMITLFVSYLLFQSILFTKNDRYFITVLPFIAYFIIYSLNEIFEYVNTKLKGKKLINMAIFVFIIILITNTLIFASTIPTENEYHSIEESCEWLNDNRIINNTTVIYSDNWPAVSWYLNIYCQRGVPNLSDVNYPVLFAKEILTKNKTHYPSVYYIDTTTENRTDIPGLTPIKDINTTRIYENSLKQEYGWSYLYTDNYSRQMDNLINEYNISRGYYV